VSPYRRNKDLKCIYTDERPDLSRKLPNWMFDESYCAGMALGAPEVSIKALNELATALGSLAEDRMPGSPWLVPVAALTSETVLIGVQRVINRRPKAYEDYQYDKVVRLPGL
jgi:hypothetical protein